MAVLADICAFSNTNGGTLYIGLSRDPQKPVIGIPNPEQAIKALEKEMQNRISPPVHLSLDIQKHNNKSIIRDPYPSRRRYPLCAG